MRRKNIKEDVWNGINKRGKNDCWEWFKSKFSNGYGSMRLDGRRAMPHRVIYELTYGSIPNKLCVLHSCDNRTCCNPDHLWLGTQADNMHDMKKKGRWKGYNNHKKRNVKEN